LVVDRGVALAVDGAGVNLRTAAARLVVAVVLTAVGCTGTLAATAGAATTSFDPVGNATPTLQPVTGVGAAAIGAPVDGVVPVVVRNAGTSAVRVDRLIATATRSDGGLAVRAVSLRTYPQTLAPAGTALAGVRFRAADVRGQVAITVKVRTTRVTAAAAARGLSVGGLTLSPPQSGAVAQTMQATLTNSTSRWTARTPAAAVMCFGEAGNPATFATAKAARRRVRPGATASVTVPLTSLCPTYLVAARAT
jgi:hypothetical protein